jgi:hypothetical protein
MAHESAEKKDFFLRVTRLNCSKGKEESRECVLGYQLVIAAPPAGPFRLLFVMLRGDLDWTG